MEKRKHTIGAPCRTRGTFSFGRFSFSSLCWRPRRQARKTQPAGNRGAAAGCLCIGERAERHPDAIAADGAKYAIRSGKTRIEKWKTDGATKRQTLANVDSIQRNLQSALPETITQLNNSPEDLAASFKLYRNLDALYDVFGSVVESAGAFGSKDEFQSLGNDMNGLESARRAFGERMQKLPPPRKMS